MPEMLEFVDLDSGSGCFAIVRRSGESVNLAFNVIGESDFEIFVPISVATKLAELITAAASAPADPC